MNIQQPQATSVNAPAESSVDQLLRAIRIGSFKDIYPVLPYVPGNIIDINIMNILNCCFQSSDIQKLLTFFIESKFYISSYMYENIIITAGRIGDSKLVTTIFEAAEKKNGSTSSLREAVLHAYRVCDAHQKVISYTYQLFSENVEISSCQYEDILRTLIPHKEYDSLCDHILGKMKEQNKFISLPVLSILLNMLDIRSSKLTTLLINQTRYYKENPPLLNLILSREMMRFSEKKSPEGLLTVYKEMALRGLRPSESELSRLKRSISLLMKSNFVFDIPKEDDYFTQIWCQSWLEGKLPGNDTVFHFVDMMKHSDRNHSVELFELFKYVLFYNSISVSLSTWKCIVDLKVSLTSQKMIVFIRFVCYAQELLDLIDQSSNVNTIQGIVLYAEEVYLAKKHRHRRTQDASFDNQIQSRIHEVPFSLLVSLD